MKHTDRLAAVIFLGLASVVYVGAWRVPITATTDEVGPRLYPFALAILLAGLSGLLLVTGKSHGGDPSITLPGMVRRFLPLVFFSFLYAMLLPWIGFLAATTLLLFASFYLLGERKHIVNIIVSASCAAGIYLLFGPLLGVPLEALPW